MEKDTTEAAEVKPATKFTAQKMANENNGRFTWKVVYTDDRGVTLSAADMLTKENAELFAAAPELVAALKAALGYMMNAQIDLNTGAPKKTATNTIEGGIKLVQAALAKAGV